MPGASCTIALHTSLTLCCAAEKLAAAETSVANSTKPARFLSQADKKAAGDQGQLKKVARDAPNLAVEQAKGLSTQVRLTSCVLCVSAEWRAGLLCSCWRTGQTEETHAKNLTHVLRQALPQLWRHDARLAVCCSFAGV